MNLYMDLHGLLNFLIVTDHKPLIPILQSKLLDDTVCHQEYKV